VAVVGAYVKSIIDSVEIHAASADAPALRLATSQGRDCTTKALDKVFT